MKKINSILMVLFLFFITNNRIYAQYCTAAHGSACSTTDNLNDVAIAGTTLANLGTGCTSITSPAYTIYAPGPNTTANLVIGQTYTFNATTNGSLSISLWIDYDHNNTFDASEWTQITASSTSLVTSSVSVTIPFTAALGTTGMRVRTRAVGSPNGAVDACTQFFSGESEDYTITLNPGSPCVAPPTAGAAFSVSMSVCALKKFTVSLLGNSTGAGQTYQWQSSLDGVNWANISGAINPTVLDSITLPTYYRCLVTCSGQSATSNQIYLTVNAPNQCYCASFAASTVDDDIGFLSISNLSNLTDSTARNNVTSVNTYTDFTSLTPADLMQGMNYPITIVQINSSANFYACFATVHIDLNQDGIFNTTDEVFPIGLTNANAGGNLLNSNINIPFTALTGITRMRIVLIENGSATQSACGSYGYGETEDYYVNILSGGTCIAPPIAGAAIGTSSLVCDSSFISLSLNGNSIGAGQTYQWRISANNVNWTIIPGANNPVAQLLVNGPSYYSCIVTCSGISATSSSFFVGIKPFNLCYCSSYSISNVDDDIGWFEMGTLVTGGDTTARSNPNSVHTYTDYTIYGAFPFSVGASYPVKVIQINSSASFYACILGVYIDLNQDGNYDSSEMVYTDTTNAAAGGNLMQGLVTIPNNATIGNTGMRVVLKEGITTAVIPCGNYGYGETEDYLVYINYPLGTKNTIASNGVSIFPNPANNELNVSFSSASAGKYELKMFDLKGQVIYSESIQHSSGAYLKKLDVTAYPKGIYNMQLISPNGIENQKIVLK